MFVNAVTYAPQCVPSRTAILTGALLVVVVVVVVVVVLSSSSWRIDVRGRVGDRTS